MRFDPWVGKIPWRRKRQPTPVFRLENPTDRGAWRATAHGVAESWTQLSAGHQGKRGDFVWRLRVQRRRRKPAAPRGHRAVPQPLSSPGTRQTFQLPRSSGGSRARNKRRGLGVRNIPAEGVLFTDFKEMGRSSRKTVKGQTGTSGNRRV